jgi:Flp pilus assembly protein TadD
MAKPMLVTLPFLLLLLDFWPLGRVPGFEFRVSSFESAGAGRSTALDAEPQTPNSKLSPPAPQSSTLLWRLILEKLPLLALSALSSAITLWSQGPAVGGLDIPFFARLANAGLAYGRYLEKLVWPTRLVVLYPFSADFDIGHLAGAVTVVIGLSYVAIRYAKRCPYLFTGWFWYLGMLVPVIGLVQVGLQSMADRYTYVPLIGLFILIAWGGYDLAKHWQLRPAVLVFLAALPILACVPLTRLQLGYWRNSLALFEHALRWTAKNYTAENNLALALLDRGQTDAAGRHLTEALRIKPDYADALSNLGMLLVMQGRIDEGITRYRAALQKQPAIPEFHHNLACALVRKGEWDGAIAEFEATLRLSPEMSQARGDLARALTLQGRLSEAKAQWSTLVRHEPDNADAHMGLGLLLAAEGDYPAALGHLREGVRLRPNDYEIQLRVGNVLEEARLPEQALRHYAEATRLNPTNASVRCQLAILLDRLQRTKEAVAQYREVLALDPRMAVALNNLAWILASNDDPAVRNGAEAVPLAQQACELTQYQEAVLVSTLGAAYAEAGRFDQAVEMARKAEALAVRADNAALADKNRKMAQLFLAHQPFHESSSTATNSPPAMP